VSVPDIRTLLRYRRPAWSKTESAFIHKYIDSVPGMTEDAYGNRLLIHPDSKTLISCHTDTVHRTPGKQAIVDRSGVISLATRERESNCLGADDTAGIYAALRMIDAGVPCSFVFHRAEEIGGRGSAWLADKYPAWLRGFDRCVALDRRGTDDVITHQAWGRCCSNGFAEALCSALGMNHTPSPHGIFTDSANYVSLIPECTNVSVGYSREHSREETLDTVYLERLIDALCRVQWDSLPTLDWVDENDVLDASPDYLGDRQFYRDPDGFEISLDLECEECGVPSPNLIECGRSLVCPRCYRLYFREADAAGTGA